MAKNKNDKIGHILEYILALRPFEFALVPDKEGYISIKELLKAVHETKDLRWINKGNINSYISISSKPLVEIKENKIRAVNFSKILFPEKTSLIPGELYLGIRRKAWPHIFEKGIYYKEKKVLLSSDKKRAAVIGKRIDNDPLIIHVSTKICVQKKVIFEKYGDELYLSDFLPKESLKGPSIEKITEQIKDKNKKREKKETVHGSFSPSAKDIFNLYIQDEPQKISWSKNKKKFRKEKKIRWPDQ